MKLLLAFFAILPLSTLYGSTDVMEMEIDSYFSKGHLHKHLGEDKTDPQEERKEERKKANKRTTETRDDDSEFLQKFKRQKPLIVESGDYTPEFSPEPKKQEALTSDLPTPRTPLRPINRNMVPTTPETPTTPATRALYKSHGVNTDKRRKARELTRTAWAPSPNTDKLRISFRGLQTAFDSLLPGEAPVLSRPYELHEIIPEAAITVGFPRRSILALQESGLISDTLKPEDFDEPYVPETPEEKAQKKAAFIERFKAREKARGLSQEDISSGYDKELALWKDYFDWMSSAREEAESTGQRFGRDDMILAFDELVAPHYKILDRGNGYKVFYSLETLDPNRENDVGETNLTVLLHEGCPTGHDGKLMNFHHFTLHDFATHGDSYGNTYLILISETLHTKRSSDLHPPKSVYKHVPRTRVLRPAFDPVRKDSCVGIGNELKPAKAD